MRRVTGRGSQVAGHGSRVTGRGSQVTDHRLQDTGLRSPVMGHKSNFFRFLRFFHDTEKFTTAGKTSAFAG